MAYPAVHRSGRPSQPHQDQEQAPEQEQGRAPREDHLRPRPGRRMMPHRASTRLVCRDGTRPRRMEGTPRDQQEGARVRRGSSSRSTSNNTSNNARGSSGPREECRSGPSKHRQALRPPLLLRRPVPSQAWRLHPRCRAPPRPRSGLRRRPSRLCAQARRRRRPAWTLPLRACTSSTRRTSSSSPDKMAARSIGPCHRRSQLPSLRIPPSRRARRRSSHLARTTHPRRPLTSNSSTRTNPAGAHSSSPPLHSQQMRLHERSTRRAAHRRRRRAASAPSSRSRCRGLSAARRLRGTLPVRPAAPVAVGAVRARGKEAPRLRRRTALVPLQARRRRPGAPRLPRRMTRAGAQHSAGRRLLLAGRSTDRAHSCRRRRPLLARGARRSRPSTAWAPVGPMHPVGQQRSRAAVLCHDHSLLPLHRRQLPRRR